MPENEDAITLLIVVVGLQSDLIKVVNELGEVKTALLHYGNRAQVRDGIRIKIDPRVLTEFQSRIKLLETERGRLQSEIALRQKQLDDILLRLAVSS